MVIISEKTNDKYYSVQSGNIRGFLFFGWIRDNSTFRTDGYYVFQICQPRIVSWDKVKASSDTKDWMTSYEKESSLAPYYKSYGYLGSEKMTIVDTDPVIAIKVYENGFANVVMNLRYFSGWNNFQIGNSKLKDYEGGNFKNIFDELSYNIPTSEQRDYLYKWQHRNDGSAGNILVQSWNSNKNDLFLDIVDSAKSSFGGDDKNVLINRFQLNRETKELTYDFYIGAGTNSLFKCSNVNMQFIKTDDLSKEIISKQHQNEALYNDALKVNSGYRLVKIVFNTKDKSQAFQYESKISKWITDYKINGLSYFTDHNIITYKNEGVILAKWYKSGVITSTNILRNSGFSMFEFNARDYFYKNGLLISEMKYLGTYEDDVKVREEGAQDERRYMKDQCDKCIVNWTKSKNPSESNGFLGKTSYSGSIEMKNGDNYSWDYSAKGFRVNNGWFASDDYYDSYTKMTNALLKNCFEKYCR